MVQRSGGDDVAAGEPFEDCLVEFSALRGLRYVAEEHSFQFRHLRGRAVWVVEVLGDGDEQVLVERGGASGIDCGDYFEQR